MQGFPLKLTMQEQIFDPKSMLDEDNFYNQRHGKPDELTSQVIYMLGDYGNNFPISMSVASDILGKAGGKISKMKDIQYTYPIMGRDFKASRIAADCIASGSVNTGATPGIGFSTFKLRFTDNWIKRQYTIQSGRGLQARVLGDPVFIDGQYEYTVQLASGSVSDYCPDSELYAGTAWIEMFAAVPESESRGTEHKSVAPGKVKNQMTHIRKSMSWAGNSANRVMGMKLKTGEGSETNLWMDYFMYQFEKDWLNECEHMYWYSHYNRQDNGLVELKDAITGKPIPTGSGLLEQIGNYSTYTRLSYDLLTTKIGTALFGQSDTAGMSITLYTGKGGMREIDRALKSKALGATGLVPNYADNGEKFIKGSGWNMELGGFFDGFAHIDGYTIKVKYNPVFDLGYVAEAQRVGGIVHPETGYPLESYRMVFIDDSVYDGQPNLQYVTLDGRDEMQHGIIKGMAPVPKSLQQMFGGSDGIISSDVDSASYHRLKVGGVQLLRSNKCFHFEMVQ